MLIVANWKENKDVSELDAWVSDFSADRKLIEDLRVCPDKVEVVVSPSLPLIYPLKMVLKEHDLGDVIGVASQDISAQLKGSHTGETGAFQLSSLVKYCIIGHSERRSMGETPLEVNQKIDSALKAGIIPIVCFSSEDELKQIEPEIVGDIMLAYEPVGSIGAGKPASIKDLKKVHFEWGLNKFIYGGSIDKKNINDYLKQDFIGGFLVGTASLDAAGFSLLVRKAVDYAWKSYLNLRNRTV